MPQYLKPENFQAHASLVIEQVISGEFRINAMVPYAKGGGSTVEIIEPRLVKKMKKAIDKGAQIPDQAGLLTIQRSYMAILEARKNLKHLADPLARATKIAAPDVDFLPSVEEIAEDEGCWQLPAPECYVEFEAPFRKSKDKRLQHADLGVLLLDPEHALKAGIHFDNVFNGMPTRRIARGEYSVLVPFFIDRKAKTLTAPPLAVGFCLLDNGEIEDDAKLHTFMGGEFDPEAKFHLGAMWHLFYPSKAWTADEDFANSMILFYREVTNLVMCLLYTMSAANVKATEPPAGTLQGRGTKDRRAWEYRVLCIRTKDRRASGASHVSDRRTPRLHLVRGYMRRQHTKNGTERRWIPPYMRGDKDAGIIEKDYEVTG